jgi:hypothetical protein
LGITHQPKGETMKYYRHISTMREEFLAQRRRDRIQAGYDFVVIVLVPVMIFLITVFLFAL